MMKQADAMTRDLWVRDEGDDQSTLTDSHLPPPHVVGMVMAGEGNVK